MVEGFESGVICAGSKWELYHMRVERSSSADQ